MKLLSYLAAWVMPSLPLTPFQWVKELTGDQSFDSLRLFQLFQNDTTDNTISQMAFLFHLLGCHGNLHNCKKCPSIFALKQNSDNGVVIGMIAYTRLSINSSLWSVDQAKAFSAVWRLIFSYYHHISELWLLKLSQTATAVDQGHCYLLLLVSIGSASPSTFPGYCTFRLTSYQIIFLELFTNSVGVNCLGFLCQIQLLLLGCCRIFY